MLMGSANSKGKSYRQGFKYGDMFLQTDQLVYSAGEIVTGKIYINLLTAFPSNKLMLRFKAQQGINIVVATDQKKEKESYVEKNLFSKNTAFIKDIIELRTWEGSEIPIGQYTIPFSFLLDAKLPGSFYQSGPYFHGHITYKLEAYLNSLDEERVKLKYKQKLRVIEPVKPSIEMNKEAKRDFKKSCFCFNTYGSMMMKAGINKTTFNPGELIKVKVMLDNSKSNIPCQEITVKLIHKITLKTSDKIKEARIEIEGPKIPRVDARSRFLVNSTSVIELPKCVDINQEATVIPKKYALLQIKGDVAEISQTSTANPNLTSSFSVEVCAYMPNHEIDPDKIVKIEFPIDIVYAKSDTTLGKIGEPEKWEALTLPCANVVVPFNRLKPSDIAKFKTIATPIPASLKESILPLPQF